MKFNIAEFLGMSEEKQWAFICSLQKIQEMCDNQLDVHCQAKYKRRVLADLAFRLRDETDRKRYWTAAREVWLHCSKGGIILSDLWTEWWIEKAQPIHWIAAALQAKEI